LIDLLGVRLNGPRAAQLELAINLVVSDRNDDTWSLGVRHGTVHARHARRNPQATVEIRATLGAFSEFSSGSSSLADLLAGDAFEVTGDTALFEAFADCLETFEFGFEIVLP